MTKYHMHRKEREITDPVELEGLLKRGRYAVISMCRDNEPYIVTLSYGYDQKRNILYFHCGTLGLKLDFLRANPKVCVMVIEDRGYKTDECSHEYASVVISGSMEEIKNLDEKKRGMEIILHQLEESPSVIKERHLTNDLVYSKIAILRLNIKEITGKKGR